MKKGKTIYLVLDGFHQGLFKYCPFISQFAKENIFSVLKSTFPPITSAAWATILTGKDPEDHGIWSFVDIAQNGEMRVLENSDINYPYFNEYLESGGVKYFFAGVPYNYPPRTKGGAYIFSWLCKAGEGQIVWPKELKQKFPRLASLA